MTTIRRAGTAAMLAAAALAAAGGSASAASARTEHRTASDRHTAGSRSFDWHRDRGPFGGDGHGPGYGHGPGGGRGPGGHGGGPGGPGGGHGPGGGGPGGGGPGSGGPAGAVFAQNDNAAGNEVVSYARASDGALTQVAAYSTGGLGGALEGAVVDDLASQGSLAYDAADGVLYAVNAGSNSISVFGVDGEELSLRQVIGSGGAFPVSIAFSHGLVYVLNAEEGGSLQGFALLGGHLVAIPGSNRRLGLASEAPQFTHTPGQVAFSPNGSQLIVTTKAAGNEIDVFGVDGFGHLSSAPVVNSEPGTVPFGVTFDRAGNVVVGEAGTNALASFALSPSGTLSQLDEVETGQAATCWVLAVGGYLYASNAGSGSLSVFQSNAGGGLTLIGDVPTDAGTVDAAASDDGRFVYVQTGAAGVLDEFALGAAGSLEKLGSVTVPGAIGGEGIAVE